MELPTPSISIDRVESSPLGENTINFLIAEKKESPFLDFKKIINVNKDSDFPEIAKDIFAFSNYGGGWILIGWEEYSPSQFAPVGLPESYKVDPAILQEKFNSYSEEPITLEYTEFEMDFASLSLKFREDIKEKINSISKRFAILFIPPSHKLLVPKKEGKYKIGEKEKNLFKRGEVFYRRGTQSIKNPSQYEIGLIKKRLEKENYRISVLSGEADEIEEKLSSNLFEVTKLPEFVYLGEMLDYDDVTIKDILKQNGVSPDWYYKFKNWEKNIVTFENLTNPSSVYRILVNKSTIKKELVTDWLKNANKNRIIVELLNKELVHYAINKGLYNFEKIKALYYPTSNEERKEKWKSRYARAERTVAAKMYAEQLQRFIYWHVAFNPSFLQINNKFYFRVLPTFVITNDGRHPVSNLRTGSIVTRLSYNKYNSSYLGTILFWIHQLGNNDKIKIRDYLEISNNSVELQSNVGILYDLPSSELKNIEEDEIIEEDETYEF